MRRALVFGRLFLFSPLRAADACRLDGEAFSDGLRLYAVWFVASLIFSWINPLSFLDPNAPPVAPHDLAFWLRVAMWEPVLFALSVFFTVLALNWLGAGWLPFKTATATLWSAVPVILAFVYLDPKTTLDRRVFAAILALWAAPAFWLARRVPGQLWRQIAAFLMGLNAVQLVGLAATLAVVPTRSKAAFYALNFTTLLWLLVCTGKGLRRLCELSAARAVLAVLFALLVSMTVPLAAYALGLMPQEVLKVLLYV